MLDWVEDKARPCDIQELSVRVLSGWVLLRKTSGWVGHRFISILD